MMNLKEQVLLSKIDEFKSLEGVRFKAKLMGNTIVEELRGKTVADYAMAKLKLNMIRQKQHKTKVIINLKWGGFFVYLSEGGQELLHSFLLENISFVWKDPCENRAFGIICSDGSIEKQPLVARFYGYKTEKSALPLIMSLKELFGLRANEGNETNEEKKLPENQDIKKEDERSSSEDLLDLKVDIPKTFQLDNSIPVLSPNTDSSNWTSFSKVDLFQVYSSCNSSLPHQWNPYLTSNEQSLNTAWSPANQMNTQQYHNPFSQPIINSKPTILDDNNQNPFGQMISSNVINSSSNIIQPQVSKPTHAKISQNKVDDLFSDLLNTDHYLDTSLIPRLPSKNSLNNNGKDNGKVSLLEIKSRQEIKEPMDFSVFDKKMMNAEMSNAKNKTKDSCALPIPLFQFD